MDVICIFVDNLRNINNVINCLKILTIISSASGLSKITHLQVIIVALGYFVSPTYNVLEMGKIETNLGSSDSTEL